MQGPRFQKCTLQVVKFSWTLWGSPSWAHYQVQPAARLHALGSRAPHRAAIKDLRGTEILEVSEPPSGYDNNGRRFIFSLLSYKVLGSETTLSEELCTQRAGSDVSAPHLCLLTPSHSSPVSLYHTWPIVGQDGEICKLERSYYPK